MNVNDSDGGCLVGKWSGEDKDYADGVMPTSWSGSEAILKQYLATRRPVKYGQCWVFGGTLTTSEYYYVIKSEELRKSLLAVQ